MLVGTSAREDKGMTARESRQPDNLVVKHDASDVHKRLCLSPPRVRGSKGADSSSQVTRPWKRSCNSERENVRGSREVVGK